MGNEKLKKLHEQAVGERFISAYNCRMGRKYRFAGLRERPDLEYQDAESGERLGVEVLTEYYSQDDARRKWADARGEHQSGEVVLIHEPDGRVVDRVLRKVAEKAANRFSYPHPLVLIVDISPAVLTTVDDFKRIAEGIFLYPPPQYRGIFLLDRLDRLGTLYEGKW